MIISPLKATNSNKNWKLAAGSASFNPMKKETKSIKFDPKPYCSK